MRASLDEKVIIPSILQFRQNLKQTKSFTPMLNEQFSLNYGAQGAEMPPLENIGMTKQRSKKYASNKDTNLNVPEQPMPMLMKK
jgi:hypothetical protein